MITSLLAKTKSLKTWTKRLLGFSVFFGFQNACGKLIQLRRNCGICSLQVAQDADSMACVSVRQQQDRFGFFIALFFRRTLKIGVKKGGTSSLPV